MNLSLYTAIDRIGLGLAVTLEFLGPLAVALAATRRRIDLACALAAGVGVYVLVLPDGSTDFLGVGSALLAAACWASYIVLNPARWPQAARPCRHRCGERRFGGRLPARSAMLLVTGQLTGTPVVYAVIAGVLSSVVPFALDLTALRTVPAGFFGIFMSAHPVLAVVAGLAILHQVPAAHEVLGIGIVVVANIVAVLSLPSTTQESS